MKIWNSCNGSKSPTWGCVCGKKTLILHSMSLLTGCSGSCPVPHMINTCEWDYNLLCSGYLKFVSIFNWNFHISQMSQQQKFLLTSGISKSPFALFIPKYKWSKSHIVKIQNVHHRFCMKYSIIFVPYKIR